MKKNNVFTLLFLTLIFSTTAIAATSDINGDGIVNLLDFADMGLYWGQPNCGTCGNTDITGDGNVDTNDLFELADNWLSYIEPPAGPIGVWNFDVGANDSSGNGYDGSLVGDALITNDIERAYVLSMDGGGDYLQINDNISSFLEKTLTVSVWIKPNSLDQMRVILDKSGIFSYRLLDGKQQFTATGKGSYLSSSTLTVGVWQHIAVVFVGNSNVKFYRNGSLINQTGYATSLNTSTDSTRIGCDSNGNYCFDGMMDDVRVYDYALSDEQISELAKKNYYVIKGQIRDAESLYDMDGVTMSGLPGNPVTDENGSYIAVLDFQWSGTVTPIKTGFTFEPAGRVYSNVTSDQNDPYEASIIRYTISGNIGSVEGVELSDFPYIPATDADGNYTTLVDYGWSGVVSPEKEGYTFSPAERIYSNVTSAQSNQDYTPQRIMTGINILAGWWSFDKGDAIDSSGFGHHGSIHGSPVWLEEGGHYQGAYSFDGTNDYITVPDFDYTNEFDEFSLSFWFKISDIAGSDFQYMYSQGSENQPNNLDVYIRNENESSPGTVTTRLQLSSGSKWQKSSPMVVADGQWHLYAITVSSVYGATVYIDTEEILSNSSMKGSAFNPDTDIYIAERSNLDSTRYFGSLDTNDGLLDDVRLFDRALSDSEIYDLYTEVYEAYDPYPADDANDVARNVELTWASGSLENIHDVYFGTNLAEVIARAGSVYMGPQTQNTFNPSMLDGSTTYYWCVDEVNDLYHHSPWPGEVWSFTTVDANMIGWWKFNDDVAGGMATDSTGYLMHGTLIGDAEIVVDAALGKVIKLDGDGDFISLPVSSFDLLNDELTIAMWAYGGETQPVYNSVVNADDGNTRIFNVHLPWGTGSIVFDAGHEGSSYDRISKEAFEYEYKGQWNHWAFTKDAAAGEMKMYLNGELWQSNTGKTRLMDGITRFNIGAAADGTKNFYEGMMDDVRIYNRALSRSELYHIYADSDTQKAINPMPEDKDWNINLTPTLSWVAGDKTASYGQDLYFGTDYDAVANREASVYIGALDTSSFNPSLKLYRQYYWVVDIVDTDNATWYGDVWSFKTRHVQTQTEGYYKDFFIAGGAGIAAYESIYATDNLGLSGEFSENPTLDGYVGTYYLMSEIALGNWDDDNGVLLYPDGEPRYRILHCGGGASVTFAENMLAPDGSGRVDAQERVKQYYAKGGSYVGNCAGSALAFEILGVSGRADIFWQFFDDFKGEFTNLAGTYTDYEIPDGVTERQGYVLPKSPLLKYYDFGGDYYINSVRQNGGNWCRWWDPAKKWPWGVAEVLTVYNDKIDGEVVREGYKCVDGASCWAYKRNDESGRMAPCGGHPEGVETGEQLELESALFAYAIDGAGCPVVKAALTDGVTRQMNDNDTDGHEKIGDRQYHHFTIDVPQGATKLEIVLDGDLYDLNLFAKHDDFAFNGEPDIVAAINGSGCDETITIENPTPGTWYIGVKCMTVPTRVKHGRYWEYTGNLETQNGLAYDITATVTE